MNSASRLNRLTQGFSKVKWVLQIFVLTSWCAVMVAQPHYEISELKKVNTSFNEYGARPYEGGIVFCSNRKNDILVSYLNEQSEEPLTQLWLSEKKSEDKFGSPDQISLSEKLRTDIGAFDFISTDTLYFTRSYTGKNGKPTLGIFISYKTGDNWSASEPFQHNNPQYTLGHPSFSSDGKKIYFAANFPDTFGESDIYVCEKVNGKWSAPKNLGPEINSPERELFPFIHPDGTLYFSSDRPGGMGGLDIYTYKPSEYGTENDSALPAPFNSESNDFSYYLSPDKSYGYFSSNRENDDDIFTFKMTRPSFPQCDTLVKNEYCYLFYDEANVSLDTLPLKYEWNLGDGYRVRGLKAEHCYGAPGTYHVELNIVDTLTGDLFFSQAQYDLVVEDIQQVYIESADTVQLMSELNLHGRNTNLPEFEIDSYHWFINDSIYREAEEINFTFSDAGSQNVILGLRSTPGKNGVVEQACIQKNIEVLEVFESTEDTVQIDAVELENNKSVYEYIHEAGDTVALDNRLPKETIYRVEIKTSKERISKLDQFFDGVREAYNVYENYIPSDSVFSYAIGNETLLNNTYPIYAYVKSINYDDVNVKAYLPEFVYNLDNFEMANEQDLNRAVFRTGSIFFETDKAELKQNGIPTINKILNLLETYPTLQLEVGAHTDNTGNSSYNLKLSQARSRAVIEYLVKKEVNPARLIGVGYGDAFPIGDNRTAKGRRINRRVEFKVVSQHTANNEK